MARQGITYTEVAEAAMTIAAQGRQPTIEQVRLLLGTGSSTTIANHLKSWKELQSTTSLSAAKENLPEELIAVMKGLWERVCNLADDKIHQADHAFQTSTAEQLAELEKYRRNNRRWQRLYDLWNKEKQTLIQERAAQEMLIENMREESTLLQTKYKLANQQLAEKQDRLQELHHLLQQTQKNYEAFQAAIKEQRQSEQAEIAAMKKSLQQENTTLKADLGALQTDFNALRIQQQKALHEKQILSEQLTIEQTNTQKIREELSAYQKSSHELANSAKHWQQQYQEAKAQHDDMNKKWIESQSQLKFMQHELESNRKKIKQVEKEM